MLFKYKETFILLADSIVTARSLASSDCIQGACACPCMHRKRESGSPVGYFTNPIYRETERVGLPCKLAIWICWASEILCIMTRSFHSLKGKKCDSILEKQSILSQTLSGGILCIKSNQSPQDLSPSENLLYHLYPPHQGPHTDSICLGCPSSTFFIKPYLPQRAPESSGPCVWLSLSPIADTSELPQVQSKSLGLANSGVIPKSYKWIQRNTEGAVTLNS